MLKTTFKGLIGLFLTTTILITACQSSTETTEENTNNITTVITSPVENESSEQPSITEEVQEIEENTKEEAIPKAIENEKKPAVKPTKAQPSTTKTTSNPTVSTPKTVQPKEETVQEPKEVSAPQPKVTSVPKTKAPQKETAPQAPQVEKETPKEVIKKPFSHDDWDALLRKYVTASGQVNYAGFKNDKAKLQAYLDLLAENAPTSAMSKNDQIAYWINAYNAFTVDLIVDNYPISSILKLDGGKTWYVKRITIGGKKYALNDIEKNILIGQFKEGRIHFAINCAAQSCPPLRNRAWKGSNLNSDLERVTKDFINNEKFNQINKRKTSLSRIFDWYKGDFGDVNAFINKYSNTPISSKTKISFNEYNWDLNE